MKSSTRISKFKIAIITLLITVMIAPILLEPLTAYADEGSAVEGTSSDGTYSSSNGKWYATYATGCGYKGQGVLVYLLEKDGGGAVAGTSPKAFYCSTQMLNYELRAQDKYNRYPMVTTWENSGPYWGGEAGTAQNGGLIKNSVYSNTEAIKTWLITRNNADDGESTNGIIMVESIWGPSVAQRFADNELILIVEPIVAIQFARYQVLTHLSSLNSSSSLYDMRNVLRAFQTSIANQRYTSMSDDLDTLISRSLSQINNAITGNVPGSVEDSIRLQILTDLDRLITGTNIYMPLGDPIAGTSKEVYKYYNELSVPSYLTVWNKCQPGLAYFRKMANACSRINNDTVICRDANFTKLYDGSFSIRANHTLDTIEQYSIGMLAMMAWHGDGPGSSSQTTCDEPQQPAPHDPPNESTGTYTIIKTYRDRNSITNQLVHVDTTHRSNVHNQILIEDESEYTVVAWKIASQQNLSIQGPTWESSVPGHIQESGTDTGLVECDPTHKYLYVLLEKGNGTLNANYNLSQSQLTRHITINNPDNPTVNGTTMVNLSSLSFNWTIGAHTQTSCGGHSYTDGCHNSCYYNHSCGTKCFNNNTPLDPTDDYCPGNHRCTNGCKCGGHTDHCNWGHWTDQSLSFALKNVSLNHGNNAWVVATNSQQYVTNNGSNSAFNLSITRNDRGGSSYTVSNKDYHTLIHRGYTQVVLADWKNTGYVGALSNISSKCFNHSNSIPGGRTGRKTTDYTASFLVTIGDAASNRTTSWGSISAAPHSGGTCSDTVGLNYTTPGTDINASVAVQVYFGSPNANGRTGDTSCPTGDYVYDENNLVISGHAVKSGTITNFRPYVQMQYDTLQYSDAKAYVLSEYTRSLTLNSFAEIEWTRSTSPNITLSSLQWSTHSEANRTHTPGTVLPGGATLTLTITSADKQVVRVRTYQPILVGDGLVQVQATGGTSTLTDAAGAQTAHLEFVETVRQNLDNIHLQQYADDVDYGLNNPNRDSARDVIDEDDNLVDNGIQSVDGLGGSSEIKYYFENDTDGATTDDQGEGDLDASIKSTSATYITIWCDTAGNIRINTGNTPEAAASNLASKIGNESQSSGDNNIVCRRKTGSTEMEWTSGVYTALAKELDAKTGIVSKLINELEKGGGSDYNASWTTDGMWYNEAFDGVTYVLWTTELNVGFASPNERITVLDPKLCPPNSGQSDLFSQFYTTQIKLEDNAISMSNQMVGTFKDPISNNSTDIRMEDLDMLYWSREFYVPNVTTQDLN